MKKISFLAFSAILVILIAFSCKKKKPSACDNGLDITAYSNCQCPEGYIQMNDEKNCADIMHSGRFLLYNVPIGFLNGFEQEFYFQTGRASLATNFFQHLWEKRMKFEWD